jgi:hypothetical protein
MYFNINDKCHWNSRDLIKKCHGEELFKSFMSWYSEYIEEYIPISRVPNNNDFIYGYRGSGQFLIHKDLIRNLPKEFYIKLYNWVITTELSNYFSSRYLEWTWHIFWVIYPNYIK